jgi:FkbM family methyltransferase
VTLGPLVTANKLKQNVARLLQSSPVASLVGHMSRGRIRNHDLTFDTRDPAITKKVASQLFWRLYEGAEIRLVRKHLRGSGVVIDLGASLGFTGSHALSRMTANGHYIAVEPNPNLTLSLVKTLKSQAQGQRVDVLCAAISSEGETSVPLSISAENVGSRVQESGQLVAATTLSAIVERFAVDKFTMISDIEGAESSFIFEDPALEKCQRMVIELHRTEHNGSFMEIEDLVDAILKRGFALMEQDGPVFAFARDSDVF